MLYPTDGNSQKTAATAATPVAAHTREQPLEFGFDDLMTMLVQPRHLKLYYAGTQKNWELAAAESRDLRAALARIGQSIPMYFNNGVAQAITSFIDPKMQSLDAAIATADSKQFAAKYIELTEACNACHVYMEHSYFVVKVPESAAQSVYPTQDFRPIP
jgi:hypothetical protein